MAIPGAIKREYGFTLIEALVSSIILAVIAGGSLTVLMVYTSEIREGVAMSCLQMQYENIAAQVSSLTHRASAVVATSETTWPVPTTWVADSTTSIFFKNADGNAIGGLQVSGGNLLEYDILSGTWPAYKAGGQTVSVTSGPKPFFMSTTRNNITLTLTIKYTNMGTTYTLSSRGDKFKCRNSK